MGGDWLFYVCGGMEVEGGGRDFFWKESRLRGNGGVNEVEWGRGMLCGVEVNGGVKE